MLKKNQKLPIYENQWPIVGICYDFDKTLSESNMQEYGLLQLLGVDNFGRFWNEVNALAKENEMDMMLSCMQHLLDKATTQKSLLNKETLKAMGPGVKLFNGVKTWFEKINNFGKLNHVNIEHYIISAGQKEIIEGTEIFNEFTSVFASEFFYDQYGKPIWLKQVVNATSKTQYLFRISKGELDMSNEDIHEPKDPYTRRIPFNNIIYIGDSDTDIPAMAVTKAKHGNSIAVYNPNAKDTEKICQLFYNGRINFFAPADYSENGALDCIVKDIILKIKTSSKVQATSLLHADMAKDIMNFIGSIEFIENEMEEQKDKFDFDSKIQNIRNSLKSHEDTFRKAYGNRCIDIEKFIKVMEIHSEKVINKITEYQSKFSNGNLR